MLGERAFGSSPQRPPRSGFRQLALALLTPANRLKMGHPIAKQSPALHIQNWNLNSIVAVREPSADCAWPKFGLVMKLLIPPPDCWPLPFKFRLLNKL